MKFDNKKSVIAVDFRTAMTPLNSVIKISGNSEE